MQKLLETDEDKCTNTQIDCLARRPAVAAQTHPLKILKLLRARSAANRECVDTVALIGDPNTDVQRSSRMLECKPELCPVRGHNGHTHWCPTAGITAAHFPKAFSRK